MNLRKMGIGLTLIAGLAVALPSCTSQEKKDAEAKAKIESTLIPEASVEVKDGVATLSGIFPDDANRMAAIESAKKVNGVKSVVDNSSLPAQVVISTDQGLTTSVNTVISRYPGVSAQVNDGVVTLTGTTNRADLQNLMQALNALNPAKIDNQLTVK